MISAAIELFLREKGFVTRLTDEQEIEVLKMTKTGMSGLLTVQDGQVRALYHPVGTWAVELADPTSLEQLASLCTTYANL